RARGLGAPEALARPLRGLAREPGSAVLDRDRHAVALRAQDDRDRPVRRRVPERVREQVDEDPLDLLRRAADERELGIAPRLEPDALRARVRLEPAHARLDDALER